MRMPIGAGRRVCAIGEIQAPRLPGARALTHAILTRIRLLLTPAATASTTHRFRPFRVLVSTGSVRGSDHWLPVCPRSVIGCRWPSLKRPPGRWCEVENWRAREPTLG
ncbi:Hypothetical predicted protein [Marmota monax]|uniref:Uncharacterized protein n=1 Tax=Marmota monax TaxID=9995 RepID=A0A5E4A2R8_MARMO|nr:Hypothetical predicted protein [Marmota monax]